MFTGGNRFLIVILLVSILLINPAAVRILGPRYSGSFQAAAQTATIDPAKSLLIRDLSVVEDPGRTFNPCTGVGAPMGKWTFGYLMTQLANPARTGQDPSKFARQWLSSWGVNQVINGETLPARSAILQKILGPWRNATDGTFDLSRAPFRLLAIVNRVDLRDNHIIGGDPAGEGRFVFGAVDLSQNCQPLEFTVNFEYRINRSTCESILDWGIQWANLSQLTMGSESYKAALELLTEQFVTAGSNPAQVPNQSSLNALVTNEIALASPWELRAFKLLPERRGKLSLVPLKQTPASALNRTPVLVDFINNNEAIILAQNYVTPLNFPDSTPFLGGKAQMVANTFWEGPGSGTAILSNEARHIYSLNTCNGCHARETATQFTHIQPTAFGVPAGLSGFMTGISVLDPSDRTTVRVFNETARRTLALEALVSSSCTP